MRNKEVALVLPKNDWQSGLADICRFSETFFRQSGELSPSRDEVSLTKFMAQEFPFYPSVLNEKLDYEFALSSLEAKNQHLESVEELVRRHSRLDTKKDKIISLLEEIVLNALVSAPKAAEEMGLSGKSNSAHFCIEWNDHEVWIHGMDSYGSFLRKNFQKSFRAKGTEKPGVHGHSGRGLDMIMSSCTDLYIKSKPGIGTWVAARIDLSVSNRENETLPKRLYLEMP